MFPSASTAPGSFRDELDPFRGESSLDLHSLMESITGSVRLRGNVRKRIFPAPLRMTICTAVEPVAKLSLGMTAWVVSGTQLHPWSFRTQ